MLFWFGGKILRDEFCIWSSKHTDPVRFGLQTKQVLKMSSFSRHPSKPLRHDTSIWKERNANTSCWPGYTVLVCRMLWHLLSPENHRSGKVFADRVCSRAARTGWCTQDTALLRGEPQDAAHVRAHGLVCDVRAPCAARAAGRSRLRPLHLISSLSPWSVRNSFWPGHVVYFQTCVQLA